MSALQLLFALLLVLGNGFFVGAEFALVSVRRSQIEPLAAVQRRARTVLYGLEHLPQMMAAAQFGVTVCSLTLGAVAEPTVAHLLEPVFAAAHVPDDLVHAIGYVLALALVVFLHLVIGEMVPKNLAMADPEKTALWLSPGLVGFARVFRPVIVVLGASARLILRPAGSSPRTRSTRSSPARELTVLVEDARRAGLLDSDEQERLEDALELGTRPVTDVLLTPDQLITLAPTATAREVEELTVRTGYSRFPVAADAGAGFLGYLHVKDVLDLEDQDRPGAAAAVAPDHHAARRPAAGRRADLDAAGRLAPGRGRRRRRAGARPGRPGGRAGNAGRRGPRPLAPLGARRTGPLTPAPGPAYSAGSGGGMPGPRPDSTSPYACIRSGSRSVDRSSRLGVAGYSDSRRSR